jgi:hypothetical protein
MHRAGANLDIVRLIENAPAARPEFLQAKDQVLEG